MKTTVSSDRGLSSRLGESKSKMALLTYMADRKMEPKHHQRKSLFWDRQHLQSENMMLRQRIKELSQNNLKTNTKLMFSQKKIHNLTLSKTDQQKSQSFFRAISANKINLYSSQKLIKQQDQMYASKSQCQLKLTLKLQKHIQQLKLKLQAQKQYNLALKRTIKNTRMNQLQIQNKQIQEQILRLYARLNHYKRLNEDNQFKFVSQLEEYKKVLKREIDTRNRVLKELNLWKSKVADKQEQILKLNKEWNQRIAQGRTKKIAISDKSNNRFSAEKSNFQRKQGIKEYCLSKLQPYESNPLNLNTSQAQLNSTHQFTFNNNQLTYLQPQQKDKPHPQVQSTPSQRHPPSLKKYCSPTKYNQKEVLIADPAEEVNLIAMVGKKVVKPEILEGKLENELDEYDQNFEEEEYKEDEFESYNVVAGNNRQSSQYKRETPSEQAYNQHEKVYAIEEDPCQLIKEQQSSEYEDLMQQI